MAAPAINQDFGPKSAIFPKNLGNIGMERFVSFEVHDIKRKSGRVKEPNTQEIKGRICLPVPANLTDSQQAQFSDDALYGAKALINGDIMKWLGSVFDRGASNAGAFGVGLLNMTDIDANRRAAGIVVDPRLTSQFVGLSFKEHTFQFTLVAKNQDESMDINRIVNKFRYFSAPTTSGSFLGPPHQFFIKFYPDDFYLYQPEYCNLTSMDVTYNGSGVPIFFSQTGAPVEVTLNLQFKETKLGYRHNVEARYGPQ